MLHLLRRATKTWAFRALFVLLIASFAVWGIGDVSLGGAGTRVAQVGDKRIGADEFAMALSREMTSLSRRAERPISMDEAQDLGIPSALLSRIVRDAALDEEARALGISADDAAVRDALVASPSFRGIDGRFDDTQYRFVVNQLGFRVDRFEEDLRRSLARETVALGIAAGVRAAPGFAERLAERDYTRRVIEAVILPADAPAAEPASEEALRAHFAAESEAYRVPETRAATWLEITPAALARGMDIAEADLRAAYAAAADRFDRPERRVVDRIVFRSEDAAREALAALEAGETDFEALAAERGLAPDDVSLGEATRAALGAAGDAVFGAGLGPVGPVATPLGPALFNVRAMLPARTTPFDEAREEIRAALAAEAAAEAALAMAEEVADLLASGASMEGIAEETGLPLLRAEAITEAGGAEGAPPGSVLVAEIFDAFEREERDVIEIGDGAFALVRTDAVTPPAPAAFQDVRDLVAADLAAATARAAREDVARDALARLQGGADLAAVATELGATVTVLPPLRQDEAGGILPFDAVETLFAAPAPGALALAVVGDEVALLRLAGIDAEAIPAQALDDLQRSLDAAVGDDLYVYYGAAVQARTRATLNPDAIQRVIDSLR